MCTGALLVGKTGRLRGLRATTHHKSLDEPGGRVDSSRPSSLRLAFQDGSARSSRRIGVIFVHSRPSSDIVSSSGQYNDLDSPIVLASFGASIFRDRLGRAKWPRISMLTDG